MMTDQGSSAWMSYGYHEKDTYIKNYPNMKLNYEKDFEDSKSSKQPHFPISRVEKQRRRVFDASMKRMMLQRAQNQRELLQDINEDSIGGSLRKELLSNDLNDVATYYDQAKGSQQERKRLAFNASPDTSGVISSEIRRINFGRQQRTRPQSAACRRPKSPFFPDTDLKLENLSDTGKSRVHSAPSSRSKHRNVQMVSKATQDYSCVVECERKQTRSGCLCCPVECRPVSNSTFNHMSSTGLQATDGPNHYQYFHYDKYLRHQRPHSAIAERIEYLETTGRKWIYPPKFTNIVRSCSIFERSSTDPRSPRSRPPKQAWADSKQENFGLIITSMTGKQADGDHQRRRKGSSDSGRGSDGQGYRSSYEKDLKEPRSVDEDDMLNDDVREQAERSYVLASTDDANAGDLSADDATIYVEIRESALIPSPKRSRTSSQDREEDDMLNDDVREQAERSYVLASTDDVNAGDLSADDATIYVEAPIPPPKRSVSFSQDREDTGGISSLNKPEPLSPPPTYFTDMLTGRVHQPENEMDALPSPTEEATENFPRMQVTVTIPDPLPIIRVSHPEVHVVDIVQPREQLKLTDSDLENTEEASTGLPTDRTGTYYSESESEFDDTKESSDKPPVSILKLVSQDFSKEKQDSVPKVTFEIPPLYDGETVDENEDVPFVVSSFATNDDEKEEEKIEVIDEITEVEELEENDVEDEEPEEVGVKQVILKQTDKSTDETVIHVDQSALIKTPSAEKHSKKSEIVQVDKPLYQEPLDEELRRLLAPPDLTGFITPVFDAPSKTKKIKKAKGSSGKKKKGKKKKKKSTTNPKPEPPAEPLFTYVPRSPSAMDVAKNRLAAMKQENTELISVMASVSKFDKECQEKMKHQPWLFGRMALSKQICRFWLPMDLKDLEGLSPSDYLMQYCAVCKRRLKLYCSTFDRQLSKRKVTKEIQTDLIKKTLVASEVEKALQTLHADCIDPQHIEHVFELVGISTEDKPRSVSRVNSKLFSAVCALTERLFYSHFVTEDAEEIESSIRHKIESADFEGLKWKLQNIKVTNKLRTLLFSL